MERKYSRGSMPLLTPNHSCKTCGGPETFTSTTVLRNDVENQLEGTGTSHPEDLLSPLLQF